MIKEILELFKGNSALDEIETNLVTMLEIASDMFNKVTEAFETGKLDTELKTYLWNRDEEINQLDQKIRRRLFTHLLVGNCKQGDVSSVLAFMTVVKDAERLGDFMKNIYRVLETNFQPEKEDANEKLLRLRRHINKQFGNIKVVLKSNDEKRALEIVEMSRRDQDTCKATIADLIRGDNSNFDCLNPVSCALLMRYFKRVLSHQINVAMAIYMPLDRLDTYSDKHEK